MTESKSKLIIGIDEAGRGALAGPVAVGVVLTTDDFPWSNLLPEVDDSKRLTAAKRAEIFSATAALKIAGKLDFRVALTRAAVIDRLGINFAVKLALGRALSGLQGNQLGIDLSVATVKLDGGLKAPKIYRNQQTIIRGDQTELIIGLASILAKVRRDRYMIKRSISPDYLSYGFDCHKGYGTLGHRQAILRSGLSPEHRRSYLKRIIVGQR